MLQPPPYCEPQSSFHFSKYYPWVWDWVWSCKAPPKLRNFLWSALHDACTTKLHLYRRRCAISPLCPICAKRDETMEHILLLCPWASRVWKKGHLHLQIDRCSIITLGDWLCSVVNQNLGCKVDLNRTLSYLVFLCWFIWMARCDTIFNEVHPSPLRTIRAMVIAMESFKLASSSMRLSAVDWISLACGVHRPSQWSPPPVNWRKVNVNVCWRRNSLCGNVGVVVRDSFSGCNAMWSVRVHASSVEMAEALAVLEGCLLAKNLQLQEVVIESDA